MSINSLHSTLTALQQISGVTMRLCTLNMETTFIVGDDVPLPAFDSFPENARTCCHLITSHGNFLLIGLFKQTTCINYIVAGPCQFNADSLATILINTLAGQSIKVKFKISHNNTLKSVSSAISSQIKEHDTDEVIKRHYHIQHQIMDAIANGNQDRIKTIISTSITGFHSFFSRVPNRRLRSAKNILYVFNTLCRIAAEKGGICPVILDRLSGHYAALIEQLVDIAASDRLTAEMAMQYCLLVQQNRKKQYTAKISQTLQWFTLHYQEKLTLSQIAQVSHSAPTYLSQTFRKETGQTVFGYLNRYRIHIAQVLLKQQAVSITKIATQVGFSNVTYFNRVFKRQVGLSPLAYSRSTFHLSSDHLSSQLETPVLWSEPSF